MTPTEALHRAIREVYLPPVMATIREIEANMSPEVRTFLTGLPNGSVWDDLRRQHA